MEPNTLIEAPKKENGPKSWSMSQSSSQPCFHGPVRNGDMPTSDSEPWIRAPLARSIVPPTLVTSPSTTASGPRWTVPPTEVTLPPTWPLILTGPPTATASRLTSPSTRTEPPMATASSASSSFSTTMLPPNRTRSPEWMDGSLPGAGGGSGASGISGVSGVSTAGSSPDDGVAAGSAGAAGGGPLSAASPKRTRRWPGSRFNRLRTGVASSPSQSCRVRVLTRSPLTATSPPLTSMVCTPRRGCFGVSTTPPWIGSTW